MSRKLRVLFLAPRIPWPLDTGGKIRCYHLLRALARRHQLKVYCFGDAGREAEGVQALGELGVELELFALASWPGRLIQLAWGTMGPAPFNIRKYHSLMLRWKLTQLSRRGGIDLVHCDHLHLAPYGEGTGLPFVIDEHNVETLIWERFSRDQSEPLIKRLIFAQQALLLRQLERRLTRRAAMVLLCSQQDQQALEELAGPAAELPPLKVVPNGVDLESFAAPGEVLFQGHVVFTGSMDWAPNENAVLAFLEGIWPAVRQQHPDLSFVVVGRNPSARLQRRCEEQGVTVTGTVPDVRPYLRGALALVVPMRVGGGTRLKILEAFASRVPVVSTALGIEGIEARPAEHFLPAESTRDFVTQLSRLRQEPALRPQLVETAYALAEQRYSWEAVGGELAEAYASRFGPHA